VELWAKNWSRRRLKALAKAIARERGVDLPATVFVPRAEALKWRNFSCGDASVFEGVAASGGGVG